MSKQQRLPGGFRIDSLLISVSAQADVSRAVENFFNQVTWAEILPITSTLTYERAF